MTNKCETCDMQGVMDWRATKDLLDMKGKRVKLINLYFCDEICCAKYFGEANDD